MSSYEQVLICSSHKRVQVISAENINSHWNKKSWSTFKQKYMILKIHLETDRWRVRMALELDILFMQNNKPVVRINMTCSSLYGKIFDNLTNEEFSQNL